MSVLLYHYSKVSHPRLQTLRFQGKSGPQKKTLPTLGYERMGDYEDHISFFFLPINPVQMVYIYGNDHPVWFAGNTLTEHVVEVDALGSFKYEVVESPEKVALYYDTTLDVPQYHRALTNLNQQKKYSGVGKRDFLSARALVLHRIPKQLNTVQSLPDWSEIKNKYAACVTHAMVYPLAGEVQVFQHRQITLG